MEKEIACWETGGRRGDMMLENGGNCLLADDR
jgi:hypothetical protein